MAGATAVEVTAAGVTGVAFMVVGSTVADFTVVDSMVVNFTAGFTVTASASAVRFSVPGSGGVRRIPGRGTTRSRRTIGTTARVPVPTTRMFRPAWSRG